MGAQLPPYNDSVGTLVTTAVLIKSPVSPQDGLVYRPSRVDLLFSTPGTQAGRVSISDFCVTLYSDDGSVEHSPSIQVRPGTSFFLFMTFLVILQLASPFLIGNSDPTKTLTSVRGVWWQIDLSSANWPLLSPATYYWVAVTPCSPLTMTTQDGLTYNGAVWVGTDDRTGSIPGPAILDDNLFRARQISSQRFDQDAAFGANTLAAVNFNKGALSWDNLPSSQYTNWAMTTTYVRYGIQLVGWQVSRPSTLSREYNYS